jgi:hypothetical protein
MTARKRYTQPERRPLRAVTNAILREGRGSFLGPDTDRRTRWYEMRLECGHEVERKASYAKENLARYSRQRSMRDVLDPPDRARCDECPKLEPRMIPENGRTA